MNLKESLRGRDWPTRVLRKVDSKSIYVREGRLFNRALQLRQELSEPIPPGESAITSLAVTPDGNLFGATSGKRAHLFRYDGGPQEDSVYDLGVIEGARAVRGALVVARDGTVFGGVSEVAEGETEGWLFRYPMAASESGPSAKGPTWLLRPPSQPAVEAEKLVPVPGECIVALAMDNLRGRVYGLSSRSGSFFSYDTGSGEITIKGTVAENGDYSQCLVTDLSGNAYGAGPDGRLFRVVPDANTIEHLPIRLPSVAGRELYNRLDAAALDPHTGLIYGGGSADGVLFVFDPANGVIRSLGKVTAESRCRAITVGLDGRVYGIAGEPEGMAHLFCYDPAVHELRDLGIPYASSQRAWHGYEFDAACTGACGEIYLGESDRISHLFMYFPTIRPNGCPAQE